VDSFKLKLRSLPSPEGDRNKIIALLKAGTGYAFTNFFENVFQAKDSVKKSVKA
jgi:hypothetical protein